MARQFQKGLEKAWYHYQDIYDRHMALLKRIGEGDINGVYQDYAEDIKYAMEEWSTPQERFEAGNYEDFDLGLDDD